MYVAVGGGVFLRAGGEFLPQGIAVDGQGAGGDVGAGPAGGEVAYGLIPEGRCFQDFVEFPEGGKGPGDGRISGKLAAAVQVGILPKFLEAETRGNQIECSAFGECGPGFEKDLAGFGFPGD